MRIIRFNLLKYGCFTDTELDFSEPDRCFRVIYGCNEAGKSTALRALTGLLYGIPHNTTDGFLHEMKDLRVGAELERRDGTRRTFIRRKGKTDTVLDADGKAQPDGLLLEFLGGATADIFATMFRMDHASLVDGGNELLNGKGDLAESLYQAGTGITRLREILSALEAESDQLFKPRSSSSAISRSLNIYEEARKRSRELAIAPRSWVEQSDAIKAKSKQLLQLKADLSEMRQRQERLNRYKLALPHVTQRTELLTQIEQLSAVQLPVNASREREDAQHSERNAVLRKNQAAGRLSKLQEQLKQRPVRGDVLENANAISSLHERLESYRLAQRDLPTVRAEQRQSDSDALALLKEVNPQLSLSQADSLRLTVAQRTRIRTTTETFPVLHERLRCAMEHAEETAGEVQEKTELLAQTPTVQDCRELERVTEELRKDGNIEATEQANSATLNVAEEDAAAALRRLTLWTGSLEELETLAVLSDETVEEFESEFAEIHRQQELCKAQRADCDSRALRLDAEIRALRVGAAVPTEQELQDSRKQRERGWRLIRRAWLEHDGDDAEQNAFDPSLPLPEAYEKVVNEADSIADRLRREAERVTKLAGLIADSESCVQRRQELDALDNGIRKQFDDCRKRWHDAWQSAGLAPLSPKEMRVWLSSQRALVSAMRDIRAKRHALQQLRQLIDQHKATLTAQLTAFGAFNSATCATLSEAIACACAVVQRLKDATSARSTLESDIRRLAGENQKALRHRDKASEELSAWQVEWKDAIAPLDLPVDTRVEEATEIVATLTEMFTKTSEGAARKARVENMEGHVETFTADVSSLVGALSPKLDGLPPDHAATRLKELLDQAQQDRTHQQTTESQIATEQETIDAADAAVLDAQKELQRLMERAHCTTFDALEQAEKRSESDRDLRNRLTQTNTTISGFCAGSTVDAFLTEVAIVDADRLPFDIEELEREIQTTDEQRSQLEQELGKERAALNTDGHGNAAIAAEEAQCALATIRQNVDRHVRLRLAAEVLRRHIDRYREQHQDPVIKRAADFFPRLTVGSFTGLKTGFDEKDRPILLGVRPNGVEVDVAGMSDGTRDQLFLALRLASLEWQVQAAEPLPFVLDDILVNFDDARAKTTLEVLAEIAQQTQLLFFTHHTKLVELAREAIPAQILHVHELSTAQYRLTDVKGNVFDGVMA